MSTDKLSVHILTPLGEIFSSDVQQVTATTTSGEITILKDHIPLVTTLATGHIMVRIDGESQYFSVAGGVLEKKVDNRVVILSSRSESALESDVQRAQEAYENAQKLAKEAKENSSFADHSKYQKLMNREFNRVRTAQKGGRK